MIMKVVWRRTREGNGSENDGKSLLSRGSATFLGSERPRPRVGASTRPPLSESGIGGISFAGDTEGRRVGRAWHGRGAEGGRVAHRRAGAECRAGHTATGIFSKIHFEIMITTMFITTIDTEQS